MNIQEVLHLLVGFQYPAKERGGTVVIEMDPRTEANKITRAEVHAALQYRVDRDNIRQIDPWTIMIVF
jgi:hypothetical protein